MTEKSEFGVLALPGSVELPGGISIFHILISLLMLSAIMIVATTNAQAGPHPVKMTLIPVCKDEGHCILCETADSPEKWARGLMFRDSLPSDQGMLFVFTRPDFWQFWMKDTELPLDLIWMDESKRIVYIVNEAQPCRAEPCRHYVPDKRALYVLETNAGVAKKWDLRTGIPFTFELPEKGFGSPKQ